MEQPQPRATWNFVCSRCGWATACQPFDVTFLPGPGRCTQVYNGPTFPPDTGNAASKVSGPCNGTISRLLQ